MARSADLEETVKLVEELDRRCVGDVADVRDLAQVQAFVDRAKTELGRVDFLLANAGIFSFGTVAEMDATTWQDMIDTNLTGVFHAMRAVLPTMIEQRFGRIVATSSMAGKLGFANVGHYVAAKWGVIGLAKSAAIEVAPHGITVNVICPTNVATDMIQNSAAYKLFRPDLENPTREDAIRGLPVAEPDPDPVGGADRHLERDGVPVLRRSALHHRRDPRRRRRFQRQQRRLRRRTTWPDGSKARWR